MTTLTEITARQQGKETVINENFEAVSPAGLFGIDWENTEGLTLGIFGGRFWDGSALTLLADTTVALTASQTNYVEATTAGVVSTNTSAFTAGRICLFVVTTTASGVDAVTDYRTLHLQGGNALIAALTVATLNIASGTITDSAPALSITQTWNDAADTFVGADMNITATASAAASLLQRWRVGGSVMASITKAGALSLAGAITLPAGAVGAPSVILSTDTTSGLYRIGANNHGYSISGAKVLDIASAGLAVTGTVSATGAISTTLSTNAGFGFTATNLNAGNATSAQFRGTVSGTDTDMIFDALGPGISASGSLQPLSMRLLANNGMTGGISVVARAASSVIRFYTGGLAAANERARITDQGLQIGDATFGASATKTLAISTGVAPSTGPADTIQLYSSDESAGHTIPSFFCEGTNVLATGQADSASSVRVKMRINGTVVTFLAI